jgi:peroxiredoxin
MAALTPGAKAPSFEFIQNMKPGEKAVVTFMKATCPTCMLAMPFIDKLYRHHQNDSAVRVVAVAQEDSKSAEAFAREYALSLPMVLDQAPYKVSVQYGLTNVPTMFVIDSDGKIEQTTIGFSKKEYLEVADRLGKVAKKPAAPLFEGMTVPDYKPG